MKRARINDLVASLVSDVRSSLATGARDEFVRAVQRWLALHISCWDEGLRSRWGLDELVAMDLNRFPVDETSLDPAEELRQLDFAPPTTLDNLAMRVRDFMWEGITLESEVECPQCQASVLRILEDAQSASVVLSCFICAWSQYPGGQRWRGTGFLQPASRATIAKR